MVRAFACLAFAAALVVSSIADACSCAPPPPPKEALEAAGAVFTGKVKSVKAAGEFQLEVTFEVDRSWKWVEKGTVTLYTGNDGAICGYGFEVGKSYLVYARFIERDAEKVLSTNICTRTAAVGDAKDDLAALGKGTAVGKEE
jgi:hypothetical protein